MQLWTTLQELERPKTPPNKGWQALENKLTGPDKRCFVSLTDIFNTSFLKFGDTIYSKTPSNIFVPICNFDKPISATQSALLKPMIL